MEKIEFYKMSGSGNDFIIVDNRDRIVDETDLLNFIVKVCRRKMSVGADGFILVENTEGADFKWRFFNSDGSVAEMCGNGARCVARFAYLNGIAGSEMSFETGAGIVEAQVAGESVKIKMTDPSDLKTDYTLELKDRSISVSSINTGVPHVVMVTDTLDDVEVVKMGREIRFHDMFAPAGTNVNFICPIKDDTIGVRTYERGVEDETLACGTGSVAGALIMARKMKIDAPIHVLTRSGVNLKIYYKEKDATYQDIYLEGDARVIYRAKLFDDAWKDNS
ncbi:MAG: diaminopimelate epimerase [Deltaproteobacteria bacterium]|jgi:diaminopimelate epimerase|nr:diaminopimelate epimerase [Deltaproteobacteria bacterium]MBW1968201.1 diaminopimelate epimerase [Deltaproteobacteria bacterium]MBW2155549.1 diaminopimelate epimerase [Deltaproteobacteria bacterium]MBW2197785.1 diaminopimelate epimerase [Deltaproteobacteria bacterium]MBW2226239.1 diaminopimelate epimerase [Deltaproteobacteria bacterium]